ncbi:hypothetical protein HA49_15385 [Tatumella morbirosei]|uniref:DUF1656 domain-containing protein n=1 Tax=Tatumella morbirosei TaxID=642227 RepID=A0A095T5F9_9GAMM|nr:DUF1656 domain-containing protein [Tatumella morbirosei]KGD72146.1 hypothetical protein HA49_15385 [Tatumella morbirosei]
MINDFNFEGVFVPGLLIIALVALICTRLLIQLFSLTEGYRCLPFRPVINICVMIIMFYLLLQGLNSPGIF